MCIAVRQHRVVQAHVTSCSLRDLLSVFVPSILSSDHAISDCTEVCKAVMDSDS